MELDELQNQTFLRATAVTREAYPPERRMSGERLSRYLDRRAFGVVSSSRPDGRPHAALTSYVRRDTNFWMPMVAGTVRERNVRQEPWLVLVITEGDRSEHIVVIVEGPCTIVAKPDAPADVAATAPEPWVSMWLRLDATRLISYAAEGARA
ncbi:MAG: pyridoxamine 5'-phosphate oxidase family protein [Actinomycetota bacterium]|nr:pyridoxamine 5'-phosphate oxidase family protein [Actinomycetota bacterium]